MIRLDPLNFNAGSIVDLTLSEGTGRSIGVTAYDGKLYVPNLQTDSGVAIVDAVTFTVTGFVLYNGTCPESVTLNWGNIINQHYGVAYILCLGVPPTGGSPGSMDPSPSERLSYPYHYAQIYNNSRSATTGDPRVASEFGSWE